MGKGDEQEHAEQHVCGEELCHDYGAFPGRIWPKRPPQRTGARPGDLPTARRWRVAAGPRPLGDGQAGWASRSRWLTTVVTPSPRMVTPYSASATSIVRF